MTQRKAFTYVELTLVLTMIVILAALAIPNFLEAQTRSNVSRSKAEMAVLKMAVDAYRVENRTYPANHKAGEANGWDLTALTTPVVYLTVIPYDSFSLLENQVRGQRDRSFRLERRPYQYLNGIQVNANQGLQIQPEGGLGGGGFFGGLIWGYGPGILLEKEQKYYLQQQAPTQVTVLPYDPTNGTTSSGDIYQRFP